MRYEPSAIAALNPITWVASASSQRSREPGRFARNASRNCHQELDFSPFSFLRKPVSQPWTPARKSSNRVLSPRGIGARQAKYSLADFVKTKATWKLIQVRRERRGRIPRSPEGTGREHFPLRFAW
jgi:hypothetical protein